MKSKSLNLISSIFLLLIVFFVVGVLLGLSLAKGDNYEYGYYNGQLDAASGKWMSVKLFRDYNSRVPEWLKKQ